MKSFQTVIFSLLFLFPATSFGMNQKNADQSKEIQIKDLDNKIIDGDNKRTIYISDEYTDAKHGAKNGEKKSVSTPITYPTHAMFTQKDPVHNFPKDVDNYVNSHSAYSPKKNRTTQKPNDRYRTPAITIGNQLINAPRTFGYFVYLLDEEGCFHRNYVSSGIDSDTNSLKDAAKIVKTLDIPIATVEESFKYFQNPPPPSKDFNKHYPPPLSSPK